MAGSATRLTLMIAFLFPPLVPDPLDGRFDILPVAERGQAKVPFAGRAETAAGGADHVALVQKLVEKVFSDTLSLGGTISGEHGIGLAKSAYLGMELAHTERRIMQGIKKVFDPTNILNPGKIFPAGEDDAKETSED